MTARGDLEILEEKIMVEVPRGREGREALRFRFVRARTAEGKVVVWHDLREFYRADDGSWKPGQKGITVRGAELRAIADGFAKATSGGQPPPSNRPLMPDEEYRQRRGQAPR